jgi:hypothetical protein
MGYHHISNSQHNKVGIDHILYELKLQRSSSFACIAIPHRNYYQQEHKHTKEPGRGRRAPPYFSEELGPRFLPKPTTAVTKRRLYCILLCARPRGFFFLSCAATLGVWPRTLPARARDPCTLPATQSPQHRQGCEVRSERWYNRRQEQEKEKKGEGGYPWRRSGGAAAPGARAREEFRRRDGWCEEEGETLGEG